MFHLVYVIDLKGGPESLIKNLSKDLFKNNFEISIVLPKHDAKHSFGFDPRIKIYSIKRRGLLYYYILKILELIRIPKYLLSSIFLFFNELILYKELKSIHRNKKIDLIEVTEGRRIDKIVKKWKVITRAHGSAWSFRKFCLDGDTQIDDYYKKWQKRQHILSNANFAISIHTKDHLTNSLDLQPKLIKFLPYPIPIQTFQSAEIKQRFSIPKNSKVILSIGRLDNRKGVDILVKSMNEVWNNFPQSYLILLGDSTSIFVEQLKGLINKKFKNRLIHPGFLEYSLIPGIYKLADIYVSASKYETFGYTILEAMASKCAVISTDRGALPELVEDMKSGILVPYGNEKFLAKAIIRLLKNNLLNKKLANEGYLKSIKYDISVIGKQYIDSYRNFKK